MKIDTDKKFIASLNTLIEKEFKSNEKNIVFNAFGIILYDEKHPIMRSMLSDQHMLDAIHHSSGQRWTIYYQKIKTTIKPSSRSLSQLLTLKSNYSNHDLFDFFEIKNQRNPHFVFFYSPFDKTNLISFEIKGKTVDETKLELLEIIHLISNVVNEADENNNEIGEGIFSTIDLNKYQARVKKIIMNMPLLLSNLSRLLK